MAVPRDRWDWEKKVDSGKFKLSGETAERMGHSEVSLGIEGPRPARYQQVSGRLARFRLWAYRSEWNSFAAGFAVLYRNEEERLDGQRVVLRALSYVRCRSWGALFAALGRSAHRTTRRPEAFCG